MDEDDPAGLSDRVQLEAKTNELAVLYGYLGPVNAFGSLTSD